MKDEIKQVSDIRNKMWNRAQAIKQEIERMEQDNPTSYINGVIDGLTIAKKLLINYVDDLNDIMFFYDGDRYGDN